mmetsp:Transcript_6254/g.8126  ORF Transcript_6254/g.8126 Transcript_6254/m.8126 type:complete len:220 (+) Transcript_6254:162-821(+)|eukprot:CAMPEP_0198143388 /NCGR_PEP_ID=MMETSP1443-20131203/6996_1 /TAXON_ID=186043 /ORGANISM="Entomoneis sp., Strain CCMP2396" /LENGTH=219 /DNA_ID=CAMNT_0043806617 /DNA_START=75 /DNA_END=734 /DNA_ORIENTATION=-
MISGSNTRTVVISICVFALLQTATNGFSFSASDRPRCQVWGPRQQPGHFSAGSIILFGSSSSEDAANGDLSQMPPTISPTTAPAPTLEISGAALVAPPAEAPPLLFEKFMTMQDKRVVVTIRYSGDAGLKPYFLTVAKKLKSSHPDVMIERRILADVEDEEDEATFEVVVDGKVVIGRGKKESISRAQTVVFVSMQELDIAISRARRKRRPSTTYGGEQ